MVARGTRLTGVLLGDLIRKQALKEDNQNQMEDEMGIITKGVETMTISRATNKTFRMEMEGIDNMPLLEIPTMELEQIEQLVRMLMLIKPQGIKEGSMS